MIIDSDRDAPISDYLAGIFFRTMLKNLISKIEEYPLTITQFLLAFSSIIALRMLGENLLLGFQGKSAEFFVGSVLVAFLFFLVSYIIILLFVSFHLKQSITKGANILLWGFFIVIFPPILDKILCGTQNCLSFYTFDGIYGLFKRFFTFFGDNPTFGITYGVRIEVALAVIFLILYFFLKTEKAAKSLLGGLIAYAIFFVLGSFPSWLTFLFLAPVKRITAIQGFDVAGIFFSPIHYFSITGH